MKVIKYAEKKDWCSQIKDEEGQKLCKGIRVGCNVLSQLAGVDTDLCTEIALKGIPCDINNFSKVNACDVAKFYKDLQKQLNLKNDILTKAQWAFFQWLKALEGK